MEPLRGLASSRAATGRPWWREQSHGDAMPDAPPLRHDIEYVLAAGRRRRRNRTAGWAIVAVVALAAAIGVPQIAARRPSPPAKPTPKVVTVRSRSAVLSA